MTEYIKREDLEGEIRNLHISLENGKYIKELKGKVNADIILAIEMRQLPSIPAISLEDLGKLVEEQKDKSKYRFERGYRLGLTFLITAVKKHIKGGK